MHLSHLNYSDLRFSDIVMYLESNSTFCHTPPTKHLLPFSPMLHLYYMICTFSKEVNRMRIPERKVPQQPIGHLWERHKEIARRLVAGHRQIDIARDYDMTPGRMSIICNSPVFKRYLESLSVRREEKALDINTLIKEGAGVGAQLLVDIVSGLKEDASIALQAKAAMDLLDREGHGKVSTVRQEVTHHLTSARIEELKRLRTEKLQEISYQPSIIDAVPA